jgi:hypothetical protein
MILIRHGGYPMKPISMLLAVFMSLCLVQVSHADETCERALHPILKEMSQDKINKMFAQDRLARMFHRMEGNTGFSPNAEDRVKAYVLAGVIRTQGFAALTDQPNAANLTAAIAAGQLNGYTSSVALGALEIKTASYDPKASVEQLVKDMLEVGVTLDAQQQDKFVQIGRETLAVYQPKIALSVNEPEGRAHLIGVAARIDLHFEMFADLYEVTYMLKHGKIYETALDEGGTIDAFGRILSFKNSDELLEAMQEFVDNLLK